MLYFDNRDKKIIEINLQVLKVKRFGNRFLPRRPAFY